MTGTELARWGSSFRLSRRPNLMRKTIAAFAAGCLITGLTVVGLTASAAPSDECTSTGSMNTTKLAAIVKCLADLEAERDAAQDERLDRIEQALDGSSPSPSATPSASPSETPSSSPSAPVSPSASLSVTPTPSATPTPPETPKPSATPSETPTQSTIPTVTPTVNPVGCVGAANTPGGPDPWGGCWPGPQNTGYPQGLPGDTRTPVKLTAYTGATTIRSCGVVIDSKTVAQDLIIEAGSGTDLSKPCVTIKNSLIKGVIFAEQDKFGPVVVTDTTVDPDGLSWWENIGRSNIRVERVNSMDSEGVVKCDSNCVVRDSWVHGMRLGGSYHYNAVGGNGTDEFTIEHNYLTCGDWTATQAGVTGDAGCSAVIGFYGDYAPATNIVINKNYLASTFDMSSAGKHRQAAYCLNPGYYPGKPYGWVENTTITNNIFARGGSGKCGVYGPTNSLNKAGAPRGNVWANNKFDDGAVINRPEE